MKRILYLTVAVMTLVLASGLVLSGGDSPAAASAPSQLVGRWSFDEGSGIMVGDSSGNGNNGTIYGATWVSGPTPTSLFGNALSFNGISNYVSVPATSSLEPSQLTVEAWVKSSASPGAYKYIVSKYLPTKPGSYSSYAIYTGSGSTLYFYIGGTTYVLSPAKNIWDGQWHEIAGSFNGVTVSLYVDRTLVGGTPTTQTINYTGTGNLCIGSYDGKSYFFPGLIDEVRIWNGALTPSQLDDMLPPEITVNGVSDTSVFTLGQSVSATWSAVDGIGSGNGSGFTDVASVIATNDGAPIISGSALNTASVGLHTLTIKATDYASNTDTITITYKVTGIPVSGPPDTTTVSGDITEPTISIDAPEPLDFGTLSAGDNGPVSDTVTAGTAGSVTVTLGSTGVITGWSVTAKANPSYTGGCMWAAGAGFLKNALQISPDGTTYSDAATGISYSGSATTGDLELYATQNVVAGTDMPGSYSIVLVFEGSVTP